MTRLTLLFCSFLLAGCGPANDGLALQRDYLERLQRSLDAPDVSSFDNRSISQYRMPARRERFSDIPELRIGLLDLVIDARRCPRLQQLISQRNSSLGKQLMPSQRLGYV